MSSRGEYLLRLLSEHQNTDNPLKQKKSSLNKNTEPAADAVLDEKPSEGSRKKEKKKKTVKNEKKKVCCFKINKIFPNKVISVVFIHCSCFMRIFNILYVESCGCRER